jgi:hypothetical protein
MRSRGQGRQSRWGVRTMIVAQSAETFCCSVQDLWAIKPPRRRTGHWLLCADRQHIYPRVMESRGTAPPFHFLPGPNEDMQRGLTIWELWGKLLTPRVKGLSTGPFPGLCSTP